MFKAGFTAGKENETVGILKKIERIEREKAVRIIFEIACKLVEQERMRVAGHLVPSDVVGLFLWMFCFFSLVHDIDDVGGI